MLVHVQRQIGLLEAQEDIKSQVQEELGERQREMFLREQLKAIQKELGDDDQSKEIAELREKLTKLELPEGGARRSRARARPPRARRPRVHGSAGHPHLPRVDRRAAVEQALRRPARPRRAPATILEEDHYGLKDVKDRVLEFLAVRQLRAQQVAEEMATTGEFPVAKLKGDDDRRHAVAAATATPTIARSPTRAKPRRAPWRAARSCCSTARRAWARRPSPSRSRARWAASTCASRSAARATRPTSAAIAARTWARCRDASSRG